jgi:hypothetical protein
MGKPKSRKKKATRSADKPVSQTAANGHTLSRLKAENRQLRASLRRTEEERDTYRRAVLTWVEDEVAKLDLDALLDRKNALPLADFIDELKAELKV